jgi:hypothetical protein
MSNLDLDQARLLRALSEHDVEFVVVGGVAAQVHGWRSATLDLDIAVSIEEFNVERLNAALASVGAGEGKIGAFGTAFQTRYGRLEIVRRADGIGQYEDWLPRARQHEVEPGITVVVADPDDVLRSKEAAGREKDRAALPQMRLDLGRTDSRS